MRPNIDELQSLDFDFHCANEHPDWEIEEELTEEEEARLEIEAEIFDLRMNGYWD